MESFLPYKWDEWWGHRSIPLGCNTLLFQQTYAWVICLDNTDRDIESFELQGYCDFLSEEKLIQAVQVGQVVLLPKYVAFLLFGY